MLNQFLLHAHVFRFDPLAYLVSGIPSLKLVLLHQSEQMEAGGKRKIEFHIDAVMLGDLAKSVYQQLIQTSGFEADFTGFMNKRSVHQANLVFHVTFCENISVSCK
jgi:primosomal replication protein N